MHRKLRGKKDALCKKADADGRTQMSGDQCNHRFCPQAYDSRRSYTTKRHVLLNKQDHIMQAQLLVGASREPSLQISLCPVALAASQCCSLCAELHQPSAP